MYKHLTLLLSLLLLGAALSFRLHRVTESAPQPDEIHWTSRGYGILKAARAGNFANLTTHLPHPGIPAAAVIAAGEYFGEKHNRFYKLEPSSPGYLDRLASGRIAIAIVSALIAPLVFLGGLMLFDRITCFLAGMLIALDLHHIAVSRAVHIDSMLTLLITVTALLFIKWLVSGKLHYKLLAGMAWGLAVSTKPTAILLLPALFAANALAVILKTKPDDSESEPSFLAWSDLWTVCIGLATFAAIYTRLWRPLTRQGYKLNIWRGRRIWIDSAGEFLQNHTPAALSIAALLGIAFVLLILLVKQGVSRNGIYRHSAHLTALLFAATAGLWAFPQIFKNLAGYWMWALGLTGVKHEAYGHVWEGPPYGYVGFLVSKPPTLVLVGAALSLLFVPGLARLSNGRRERLQAIGITLCALTVAFWLIGLSTSSKQAWRYAMPVVPVLTLAAAYGLMEGSKRCAAWIAGIVPQIGQFAVQTALVALLLLTQAGSAVAWSPNPDLFFNFVSGGLQAAVDRRSPLPFVSQNEVVDFLHAMAKSRGRGILRVSVIGDPQTLEYAYLRLHPELAKKKHRPVEFSTWFAHARGEYIVINESVIDRLSPKWEKLKEGEPVYVSEWEGVPLVSIYRVSPPTAGNPFEYGINFSISHVTGKLERGADEDDRSLVARPGRDRAGYLLYEVYANLDPGKYDVQFMLRLPEAGSAAVHYPPAQPAVRVELGQKCTRNVLLSELAAGEYRPISFPCAFENAAYMQLRVYWYGKIPVAVNGMKVSRLAE